MRERGAGQPVVEHPCGNTSQRWALAYLYLTQQLPEYLDALMNSAEGYLQVWERAEARGPSGP